ncbi:cyclic peptide export ABC transporter [Halomonas sp. SpR1]|uniref:cyclic peptide export ABC transporter n=1 Tax=Halomonas sp. SpR1 TaxID=3050462 RepID=UPI0027E54AAE|nr:cyclic peptide export ABC transporter [Halomonas sp. SpR1]MDQ7733120.1 cyclic peptide export ABC transporter [Halomonas sp. SpR1]
MNVTLLLFRICGKAILPLTILVLLSAGSTILALQLIGRELAGEIPEGMSAGLWFSGAVVLLVVSRLVSRNLLDWLSMRAIARIRHNLAKNILRLPLTRIEELGVPKIMAHVFDDVARIGAGLSGLPNFLGHVIVLIGAMTYLGFVSTAGLAALLTVLILGVICYRWLLAMAMNAQRDARNARDGLYDLTGGMARGAKELRFNAHRKHHFFEKSFSNMLDRHFRKSLLGAVYATTGLTLSQVLYFVCLGVIVFAVPQFVVLDRAALMKFAVIVLYLPAPIEGIVQFFSTLTTAQVSIERLQELGVLDENLHRHEASAAIVGHGAVESLSVSSLEYTYKQAEAEERDFHVGPLDLVFRPGEIVFFVGGNGSGKTTSAKVITSLYEADSGTIHLNGQPISADNIDWYRQHFAGVFSDYHVFDAYPSGSQHCDQEVASTAERYLERLELEKVVRLEGGMLSTTTALSTGQRKRLALLVVLLEDKPVVIFDEWASDQDPAFRETFYLRLLPELAARGKIVIVVTHDDDYFAVADRIVTFRYGKVESDLPNERMLVRRPAVRSER